MKLHYLIFAVMLSLVLGSCSKEELPITQIPIDDLGASYVELDSKSVEIPADMHQSGIISRTDDEITIAKSVTIQEANVGSYLVSAFETPHSQFVLRKVVGKIDNGSSISYQTVPATVVEAYERYYINSENTQLITYRSGGVSVRPVFDSISTKLTELVNGSLAQAGADTSNFELDLKFIMDGEASFEAIHPNTAYEIFTGASGSIDTTDVNPQNGVWDVADQQFGALDSNIDNNGLFTIRLDGFEIADFSASIVHEVAAFENKHLDGIKKQGVADVVSSVAALAKSPIDVSNSSEVNMKYLPTGLTVGAFSINAAIGPVIELDGNLSLFADCNMEFPNSVDIQFGHLNWRELIPDFDTDIQITQGPPEARQSVSISKIFEDPVANLKVGAKGHLGMKFGFAVGLAGTAGEGNAAGGSIGCAIPVTLNATVDAEGAIQVNDVFAFEADNISLSGQICTDVSVEVSAVLFTDVNIQVDFADQLFDVIVDFPDAVFPPQELSLLSWSDAYEADNGICFGYSACNSISLHEITVALDSADLATRIAFQFNDENTNTYSLELSYDGNSTLFAGPYTFNQYHEADAEIEDNILAGILSRDLEVKVIVADNGCEKIFRPEVFISTSGCNGGYVHEPDDVDGWTRSSLSEDAITYFPHEIAAARGALPSISEVIDQLTETDCANSTGIALIDYESNEYRILNNDRVYVWIVTQPNLHNLLEVLVERRVGQPNTYSWETYNGSESTLAPLLNI